MIGFCPTTDVLLPRFVALISQFITPRRMFFDCDIPRKRRGPAAPFILSIFRRMRRSEFVVKISTAVRGTKTRAARERRAIKIPGALGKEAS